MSGRNAFCMNSSCLKPIRLNSQNSSGTCGARKEIGTSTPRKARAPQNSTRPTYPIRCVAIQHSRASSPEPATPIRTDARRQTGRGRPGAANSSGVKPGLTTSGRGGTP